MVELPNVEDSASAQPNSDDLRPYQPESYPVSSVDRQLAEAIKRFESAQTKEALNAETSTIIQILNRGTTNLPLVQAAARALLNMSGDCTLEISSNHAFQALMSGMVHPAGEANILFEGILKDYLAHGIGILDDALRASFARANLNILGWDSERKSLWIDRLRLIQIWQKVDPDLAKQYTLSQDAVQIETDYRRITSWSRPAATLPLLVLIGLLVFVLRLLGKRGHRLAMFLVGTLSLQPLFSASPQKIADQTGTKKPAAARSADSKPAPKNPIRHKPNGFIFLGTLMMGALSIVSSVAAALLLAIHQGMSFDAIAQAAAKTLLVAPHLDLASVLKPEILIASVAFGLVGGVVLGTRVHTAQAREAKDDAAGLLPALRFRKLTGLLAAIPAMFEAGRDKIQNVSVRKRAAAAGDKLMKAMA
jgi:hypothetical protein